METVTMPRTRWNRNPDRSLQEEDAHDDVEERDDRRPPISESLRPTERGEEPLPQRQQPARDGQSGKDRRQPRDRQPVMARPLPRLGHASPPASISRVKFLYSSLRAPRRRVNEREMGSGYFIDAEGKAA